MFRLSVVMILMILITTGCASEIMRTPAHLSEANNNPHRSVIIFHEDMRIKLGSGYWREIKAGTKWLFVGTIKEGDVFKPYRNVFTIEGAHVREAYLVISNDQLIGFYIPGEDSYSSLKSSISLPVFPEQKYDS
ncbi:MAG: hypothetical protein ABW148_04305 [Sedimenticola sp.]